MAGKDLKQVLNIAHRGASAYAYENTIESIEKAIELGADMVEFDLRRTVDCVIADKPDILNEIQGGIAEPALRFSERGQYEKPGIMER